MGVDVTYGSEIQLMHVDSKMFLSGMIKVSESLGSAYKVELSDDLSMNMVFQFLPKYKLRQMGEIIFFSDLFLIYNVKIGCYLNFCPDEQVLILIFTI